jgi:hypothetical protein
MLKGNHKEWWLTKSRAAVISRVKALVDELASGPVAPGGMGKR